MHVLPLARLFDAPEYRWVAALMIATGLAGGLMAGGGSAELRMVSLACAVVLWGSVVWTPWQDGSSARANGNAMRSAMKGHAHD